MSLPRVAVALVSLPLLACAGPSPVDARYPVRPPGCQVRMFDNAPPMPTDNLGTVRARCGTDISRDDCIRELDDQACRLGADVVWGVDEAPRVAGDKNEWSGRAAHTR